MAAKGSAVKTITRHPQDKITAITWTLTANADGDADGDTIALGPNFFQTGLTGTIIGCMVDWTDATANYDFYLKDARGFDLLQGLGVDMAGDDSDADHRFCPALPTNVTNHGVPLTLINETVEIIGDEMGNGKISSITIYIADIPESWR